MIRSSQIYYFLHKQDSTTRGHAESPYHKYILHSEGTDVLFFNSFTNPFVEPPMPPLSLLRNGEEYKGELSIYMGRRADLYWSEDEAI